MRTPAPDLSVVIPVYDEQETLNALHDRLESVLRGTGRSWEIVYVDDGSRDRSLEILKTRATAGAGRVRVVELYRNTGQFAALAAGLAEARGDVVVTLDADLQNPPEDIPRLLAKIDEGHDVVNGWRQGRHDSAFRRFFSRLANGLARAVSGLAVRDYGCMLRACRREVIDQIVAFRDHAPYIPVLANRCARRPAELAVSHAGRQAGASKYSLRRLVGLQFDMVASLPGHPWRLLALSGALLGFASFAGAVFLGILAFLLESGALGGLVLFAVLFFLVGLLFVSLALVAEYAGRTYDLARQRPAYVVRRVHGPAGWEAPSGETAQRGTPVAARRIPPLAAAPHEPAATSGAAAAGEAPADRLTDDTLPLDRVREDRP